MSSSTVNTIKENDESIRLYEEMPNGELIKHILSNPNVKKEIVSKIMKISKDKINYIKPYWYMSYIHFEKFIEFLIDKKRIHNWKIAMKQSVNHASINHASINHMYTIHEILDNCEFHGYIFDVYVVRDENDFWYYVIPVLLSDDCWCLTRIYKYDDEFIYYNKENDIFIHPYCVPHIDVILDAYGDEKLFNIIVNGNKISFECPCCKNRIFKKEYVTNIEENKLNSLKPFIQNSVTEGHYFSKVNDFKISQYKSNEINLDEIINVISPYKLIANYYDEEDNGYRFKTASDSLEQFLKDCEEIP